MSDIKSVLGSTSSTSGSSGSSTKNIWVSGLSSNTKAADLKNLFGKYGKVHFLSVFLVSPFEMGIIFKTVLYKTFQFLDFLRTGIDIITEFCGTGEFCHKISPGALGLFLLKAYILSPFQ